MWYIFNYLHVPYLQPCINHFKLFSNASACSRCHKKNLLHKVQKLWHLKVFGTGIAKYPPIWAYCSFQPQPRATIFCADIQEERSQIMLRYEVWTINTNWVTLTFAFVFECPTYLQGACHGINIKIRLFCFTEANLWYLWTNEPILDAIKLQVQMFNWFAKNTLE